jgi:hypothetical protein
MIQCDYEQACTDGAMYISSKGFAYCANHAPARNDPYVRCRKLRPHEMRRLERGETLARY